MIRMKKGEVHAFEAPEVDLAAQAPEHFQRPPDGLQVQNGVEPELLRSREPGIVLDKRGLPEVAHDELLNGDYERPSNPIYSRPVWLAIALITLILAVALGVGLGVGLQKKRSSITSFNSTSHAFTLGAVNDTSLAAVMTPDRNRHVFLQDINGTLRHAVFASEENLWLSNVDYLLPLEPVSAPRLGTPLAATYPGYINPNSILVYYINTEDSLSVISYTIESGVINGDAFNGSIAIEPGSRCLTASTIDSRKCNGLPNQFVFFEARSGSIAFLYGHFVGEEWTWQDMSGVLDPALWRDSADEKGSLGCPCTSSTSSTTNTVQATFFNPEFLANPSAPLATTLDFSNATKAKDFPIFTRPNYGDPAHYEVLSGELGIGGTLNFTDIIAPDYSTQVTGGAWLVINETLRGDSLRSKFPFGRLAWLASNTSSLYIYHQVNESTLAEEEDIAGAGWNTRLITITTD